MERPRTGTPFRVVKKSRKHLIPEGRGESRTGILDHDAHLRDSGGKGTLHGLHRHRHLAGPTPQGIHGHSAPAFLKDPSEAPGHRPLTAGLQGPPGPATVTPAGAASLPRRLARPPSSDLEGATSTSTDGPTRGQPLKVVPRGHGGSPSRRPYTSGGWQGPPPAPGKEWRSDVPRGTRPIPDCRWCSCRVHIRPRGLRSASLSRRRIATGARLLIRYQPPGPAPHHRSVLVRWGKETSATPPGHPTSRLPPAPSSGASSPQDRSHGPGPG